MFKTIKSDILSSRTGMIGSILFLTMLLISVFALVSNPLDFGTRIWNNPLIWSDNPKNAPPSWSTILDPNSGPKHRVFNLESPTHTSSDGNKFEKVYVFDLPYKAGDSPTFMSISMGEMVYWGTPPTFSFSVSRPDDKKLDLYKHIVKSSGNTQEAPKMKYTDQPLRVYLSGDDSVSNNVNDFVYSEFQIKPQSYAYSGQIEDIIFGTPDSQDPGHFKPLEGTYEFMLSVKTSQQNDTIGKITFVMGGAHYGLMGTDSLGRDLARGLIFGFPVALTIGLITSIIATAIGTTAGIVSGYIGGKTDLLIQRFCDILSNMPLLPLLLFLAFILGQKLWVVIAVMIAFGWPGLTIIVRSMVLQLRSGSLIESTIAIGASRRHIMIKHIFPQIAPFILAQMIFFTPAAILAEAGLSFLGLGDPSIPTWGQILDQGFRTGAVYIGYWWWVIPPGLLIVLTALTFVLLALALERVVDPRLKGQAR